LFILPQIQRGEGRSEEQNGLKNAVKTKLSKRVKPALWMDLATLPLDQPLKITHRHKFKTSMDLDYTREKKTRVSKLKPKTNSQRDR
jgi:hypothetical protein